MIEDIIKLGEVLATGGPTLILAVACVILGMFINRQINGRIEDLQKQAGLNADLAQTLGKLRELLEKKPIQ
jgi:hypothetical protein